MYKVKEEALLQELTRLTTEAEARKAQSREDARGIAEKRGYDAEKTKRIAELLLSEDETYFAVKGKYDYLSAFVEEVEDAKEAADEPSETVAEVRYGEARY